MDSEDLKPMKAFVKLHNILKDSTTVGINERLNPIKFTPKEVQEPKPSFKENGNRTTGLSLYELERLDNIRQNKEFLSSIKLFEAKEDLKQKTSRTLKTTSKTPWTEILPTRAKSVRIQTIEAKKLRLEPEIYNSTPKHWTAERRRKSTEPRTLTGPICMKAVNMKMGSKLPSKLVKLWREESVGEENDKEEEEEDKMDIIMYRSALKDMELSDGGGEAKVVKDSISSTAFHPCCSRLLLAAGDRSGIVGLWNLDSDVGVNGVLQFKPHSKAVASMAFSRSRPTDLLTLSYDGTLRSTNVTKAIFDEVYWTGDGLKTFDFLSHDCSTLLVGNSNGDVAIIDRRTSGTSHESLHSLDNSVVSCVHVHPVQNHIFMVPQNSIVSIYDIRCMKKSSSEPVSQLFGHSDYISSAYFSPGTGNTVLTSCKDDRIRIYDTSEMISEAPLLTSIKHEMETERWMSDLKAVWDPKKDDCFVVGSIEHPGRIQVFQDNGQLLHSIQHPKIKKKILTTAFHPIRNALLGGNVHNKVYVFTD
ncbi:hypothetical protein UPYG_G00086580 [Umbra pygmaea]|uniref:WD repeat-containing protein 76 n=1 Tax=Umbra pygmaea TaxID=75934 RepID=A0ABD0XZ76_UMBPY